MSMGVLKKGSRPQTTRQVSGTMDPRMTGSQPEKNQTRIPRARMLSVTQPSQLPIAGRFE